MSTTLRVEPDNYGEWRWSYVAEGQVLMSSYRSHGTRDEAVADAEVALTEAGVAADRTFLDGVSSGNIDKMRPPKVDAVREANAGNYPLPGQEGIATDEQLKVKQELVQKMIDADITMAKKPKEKAPEEQGQAPDAGMEEPKTRSKKKLADGTDAPKAEEEPNPLAAQQRKKQAVTGEV